MKKIRDIRIYKSSEKERYIGFINRTLNLFVRRLSMKLREQNFSLGEFDHLYLNFTVCKPAGVIELIDTVDHYHPWYRYCDVGVNQSEYDNLENSDCAEYIFQKIEAVLLSQFSTEENISEIVKHSMAEAQKGSEMLIYLKEKNSAKGIATIYLRLLNNGKYLPLLHVTDLNGNDIFCADLPETLDLNTIGDILLSSKRVTVKPRKNAFTKGLEPISFDLNFKIF